MSKYSIGSSGSVFSADRRLMNDVKYGRIDSERARDLVLNGPGGGRNSGRRDDRRATARYEEDDDDNSHDDDDDSSGDDVGGRQPYSRQRNTRHAVVKKKKKPLKKEKRAIERAYNELIDDGEGACPLCCSPLRGCFRVIWYCVLLFVGLMCLLVVLGWLMKLFMTIWPWL